MPETVSIGQCYKRVSSCPEEDSHVCIITDVDPVKGIAVFTHPKYLSIYNRSIKSRIGEFHNWGFSDYNPIPLEQFLEKYREAVQEQLKQIIRQQRKYDR